MSSIVAVNDHALHVIEGGQGKHASALSVLWPFGSSVATPDVVRETFGDAMAVLSHQLQRVRLEGEASLVNLDRLEERLQTLHEIIARENQYVTEEKSELLAQLWTVLGGNRRRLKGINGHLYLLRSIGEYRERARAHVVTTMQALEGMDADMEELRERVAAPEIVGGKIPVF